jgi:hypothetical protein
VFHQKLKRKIRATVNDAEAAEKLITKTYAYDTKRQPLALLRFK